MTDQNPSTVSGSAAADEARAVLSTPTATPPPEVLDAVHVGLLSVPEDGTAPEVTVQDPYPQMAIRRRSDS